MRKEWTAAKGSGENQLIKGSWPWVAMVDEEKREPPVESEVARLTERP